MSIDYTPDIAEVTDIDILALTIYGESRGEPIEGQIAVANVIRNRMRKKNKSYREICLEPEQFSCWNDNDPNYSILGEMCQEILKNNWINATYQQCLWVAVGISNNQLQDNTNGAMNYLTKDLFNSSKAPLWARNVTIAKSIGKQVFIAA